jgi:hypothetical protein
MRGISVPRITISELDDVLRPIASLLDACWWYLGGSGLNAAYFDDPTMKDYDLLIMEVDGARVGRPGFYGRLAAKWGGDWDTFYVSDSAAPPATSFVTVSEAFDGLWFDPPPADVPQDIFLIVRDLDSGRWDLFFRDDWAYQAVWSYLRGRGVIMSEYPRTMTEGDSDDL